jgi:PAS domain S-box-containing protein
VERIKQTYRIIISQKWFGYVFALAAVALATWFKVLAEPDILPANVPIFYILAIVITATFFGLWPSIFCSVISMLAFSYFFLPPLHTLAFELSAIPITLIFLFTGVIISVLSNSLRKRTEEAKKEINIRKQREAELIAYHDSLEELVKKRTAKLEEEEQALKESEERFFKAFADSPVAQTIASLPEGRWVEANDSFLSLVEYTREEVIGHTSNELKLMDPRKRGKLLDNVINTGSTRSVEVEISTKTGKSLVVISSTQTIILNGKPHYISTLLDITNRKAAEENLQKIHAELEVRIQERTRELAEVNKELQGEIAEHKQAREAINAEKKRFDDVLEMLPAYVVLLTPDYHVPFANRFFEERFGKSMGKRCFEYLFHRNEPCETCETYKVLKTNAPHHWEWTGPDGHNYDIYDFPFKDIDGSPLIMEMGIDITEQKQAQAALQKSQAELETRVEERTKELLETRDYLNNLFNYANAPIIVWNPNYEITRFNHAFERLTGRTSDEVIGAKLDILFPAESHDESMQHIRVATSGGRWEVVEIPIVHKDSTVCILLWNSANLYTEDGKTVIATIAQGQDITERKKVEQMKDEFIGLVSHELRTPMTVITGSLKTALSKGISAKDKQTLLENAIEGAGALSAILENLLELSRYQTGRLQIHRETVDLSTITNNVIEKLKPRSEGHSFRTEFPKDLPSVEADTMRVERILYNLLENAVKYSPEGSEIKVFAQKNNDKIIVGVDDKGIGISAEDQSRIFEPFERLRKAARQGLGLGLVVCKRLVEAQGGHVWVESEPDKGSTFYFSLPVHNKIA